MATCTTYYFPDMSRQACPDVFVGKFSCFLEGLQAIRTFFNYFVVKGLINGIISSS